jgi:acyl carrier protein phosphodiesterase
MVQRTSLPSETEFAMKILEDEYQFFNKAFNQFFPEIISFVETKGDYEIERPFFERERE